MFLGRNSGQSLCAIPAIKRSIIVIMAAEDSSSLPHLAFVYGTLKRGEPQAKVMEDVEK